MKVSNLIPKSRLSFSVFIIILFAIFFIGYYFYYIPVNREELHKDGFLILKNIKTSIEERNSDLQKLYKAFFKKNFDENKSNNDKYLQNLLDSNEVSGKVFKAYGASSILSPRTLSDSAGSGMQRNEVRLAEIKKGNLIYLANNKNYDSLAVALPVDKLLDPILQSQKTELFGSYLLINKRQGLIYKDKDLSIGSGLAIDSLLSKNKDALFAGIKDARIEDVDYKVFYYPFDLGNEEVELCGFVKTSEYNERLHNIPVTFIYPIVILFLLLLIFLPLIKFYLMGPDEHVKFIDIAFSVLSFFVGATLLTLIMIQVLLLMAADIRAKENLSVLATQIDSSFSQELNASYRQLDSLDNFMSRSLDKPAVEMLEKGKNLNVSDLLKKYFYTHHNDTSLYYNFNRIFWVDTMGWQRVKGQLENTDPVFTNVSARNYFKVFKNNEPFLLPGQQESQFGFEPVNSWTDGEFRIVVSKKSNLKGEFITALATQMYSVTQTILPPGYGFCIIDKDGNVQLHSEMERNLQENILEKIASSRQIKESITSRQETFFNSLNFYGKTNAVTIQPVSKIPFYIITFCDKGYIVPVNMRIFSFALLFCFITFFTCMLIWFFVFRKRYYSYPMLYPPLLFLKWAIPKKSSMQFYVLGTRFLSGYASMLLIFLVLAGILKISNYVILVLVFMIPANVISGLFVLTYATIKQNDSNRKEKITQWSKKALTAISFQLTASVAIYFLSYSAGYAIELHFLIFQLLFNSVMWMYYFSSQKTLAYISKSTKHYVSQYSRLATLLIICLAVLPAGLYTWYAHNQEITQSLKKEQLYLAESLQQRRDVVKKSADSRNSLSPQPDYYEKLQYRQGIYKIYHDSIIWKTAPADSMPKKINNDSYEQFYFAIANDIGNNYYDPQLFPALKDSASDKAWYWSKADDHLSFWYNMYPDMFTNKDSTLSADNTLKIISKFPDRYKFAVFSLTGLLLAFIVFGLIRGLYWLLSSLTEQIFLKKFIETEENTKQSKSYAAPFLQEYFSIQPVLNVTLQKEIQDLIKEYDHYKPGDNREIYVQEKTMFEAIEKFRDYYEFVWTKCSEKEKYLLLDFAQDSLINFKNSGAIYNLLKMEIFTIHEEEIKLFSASFRSYILTKKGTEETMALQKQFLQNSNWQSFRVPLLMILLAIALFIFFTQEQTFQKITAMVAGVSSVVSLMMKFFVDATSSGTPKK